jgi:hypothetical protein
MSQGQGGGRPPAFESASDLEAKVKAYFLQCDQEDKPYGIYGLISHLSIDPTTFYDYESGDRDTENEKFSHILKRSRLKVVAYAETKLYDKTAGSVAQLVNTTRKFPEPFKNAQHQEITGKDGGALEFALTDRLKEARERAQGER